MIAAKLNGRNLFHVKYIKLSYRMRGSVARIQTNNVARSMVLIINCKSVNKGMSPINMVADSRLINKIFIYSAMKIRANKPALYSTLNPDTSSDSPSAKSNGVRLVSAKLVMNHIIKRGKIKSIIQDKHFIMFRSMDFCKMRTERIMSAMETSYEIVCAIPRNAPRSAYLELEHHPAINVV